MILMQHVGKTYAGGQEALARIDFALDTGEFAFLTGHSGAGKSTLLKLAALIERPTCGVVVINGENVTHLPDRRVPYLRRRVGVVFQHNRLLYDRTVFDNVALPLVIAGCRRTETARRTRAALDKVGLLRKEKKMPITLSGGEQQRVGIARAVVNKPPLLLADEPTGNLDPDLSREILGVFEDFNRVGVSILVASHDLSLIESMSKPIHRLHNGRLLTPPPPRAQTRATG